jgi:hypothetical protein
MVLGAAVFLILVGSAALGALMLAGAFALLMRRKWRRAGAVVLCAGCAGATLGSLALLALIWLMQGSQTPAEAWLLFASSGFGWAGLLALGLFFLIPLLRQPNRWADRRRNADT